MAKLSLKESLTLAPKTAPVRKSTINVEEMEQAVQKIHPKTEARTAAAPEPPATTPEEAPRPRTKRVTVDIPLPLHAAIKMRTFRDGITIKEYLLMLAERDLGA